MPVVTEFVARETQGCHIGRVDYMPVIAEFVARETQDLRLYWAGAVIYISRACFYNIQAAVS